MTPDPTQSRAIEQIREWLARPGKAEPLKYLAGPAGSGKTTIAREAVLGFRARFAAPTGKAALVLRSKGCVGACTLHSLLYRPSESYEGSGAERRRVVKYSRNPNSTLLQEVDVVVADECSMISAELAGDLLAFGIRVLVIGDPYQLPPVEGKSPFASKQPDWLLSQIHRQEEGSGILELATDVREGRALRADYGPSVTLADRRTVDPGAIFAEHDQVLVGTHRSRRSLNRWLRDAVLVQNTLPVAGDRVVCRRNNAERGLINGSQWNVTWASYAKTHVEMVLESLDDPEPRTLQTTSHPHLFRATYEDGAAEALKRMPWAAAKAHQEFDYAYAMTVHSAQGSQWDSVCVLDESACFREDAARHLYTAVTRAARRVTVLV